MSPAALKAEQEQKKKKKGICSVQRTFLWKLFVSGGRVKTVSIFPRLSLLASTMPSHLPVLQFILSASDQGEANEAGGGKNSLSLEN